MSRKRKTRNDTELYDIPCEEVTHTPILAHVDELSSDRRRVSRQTHTSYALRQVQTAEQPVCHPEPYSEHLHYTLEDGTDLDNAEVVHITPEMAQKTRPTQCYASLVSCNQIRFRPPSTH